MKQAKFFEAAGEKKTKTKSPKANLTKLSLFKSLKRSVMFGHSWPRFLTTLIWNPKKNKLKTKTSN